MNVMRAPLLLAPALAFACACSVEPRAFPAERASVLVAADGSIAVDGAVVFRRGDASAEPIARALAPIVAAMEHAPDELFGTERPTEPLSVRIAPDARYGDFVPLLSACLATEIDLRSLELATRGAPTVIVRLPEQNRERVDAFLFCPRLRFARETVWRVALESGGRAVHVVEDLDGGLRMVDANPLALARRAPIGSESVLPVRCDPLVAWRDVAAALAVIDAREAPAQCPLPAEGDVDRIARSRY